MIVGEFSSTNIPISNTNQFFGNENFSASNNALAQFPKTEQDCYDYTSSITTFLMKNKRDQYRNEIRKTQVNQILTNGRKIRHQEEDENNQQEGVQGTNDPTSMLIRSDLQVE